jgi:hypothetical protein
MVRFLPSTALQQIRPIRTSAKLLALWLFFTDFQGIEGYAPLGWIIDKPNAGKSGKPSGKISILNDGGDPYCHIELSEKKNSHGAMGQGFDVDDSLKKVTVTARLRCANIKNNDLNKDPRVEMYLDRIYKSKETGITVSDYTVTNVVLRGNKPNWKSYTISAEVKPGNTKFYLWFKFYGLTGELDVDDVEVEFR